MTEPSDSSYVAVKRVDPTGRIDGLVHHAGKEVLVVRLPYLEKERMDAWVRDMEEEAARVAKRLDLDPERARGFVRNVAQGASDAGRATMEAVNKLTTSAVVRREAMEEQQAVQDVALAARRGGADWEPNPADKDAYEAEQRRTGSGTSSVGTSGGRANPAGSTTSTSTDRNRGAGGAGGP